MREDLLAGRPARRQPVTEVQPLNVGPLELQVPLFRYTWLLVPSPSVSVVEPEPTAVRPLLNDPPIDAQPAGAVLRNRW